MIGPVVPRALVRGIPVQRRSAHATRWGPGGPRAGVASPTGFEARDGAEDAGLSDISPPPVVESSPVAGHKRSEARAVAQPDDGGDLVVVALTEKLEAARLVGDWAGVAELARELEVRAKARVAGVVDFGAEKRRRGR